MTRAPFPSRLLPGRTSRWPCAWALGRLLGVCLIAVACLPVSSVGQGIGASAMVGAYRSLSPAGNDQHPGVGAELLGHWAFPSGVGIGIGARYVAFPRGGWDRITVFLDGRYAPTSRTRRLQPVGGLRAGPYYGGGVGDGDGNPLFGVEAAAVIGLALRASAGVSFTMLGDLGVVLSSNDPDRLRRFFPGLQLGLTLH